jgi:FkbM family methyltransferase
MGRLDGLADWVRHHPILLRGARLSVRLIPDVHWTRRFPELGPLRFRLRRQRWFLWERLGKHDRFMLGVFQRLVRPGDVVYDVGANIGVYTRMLAQWFKAGHVVAFEPMSDNVSLLRDNVALGGLRERVTVLPLALGDHDGEERLQIDDVRSSTAVLDRVSGGAASAGRRHFNLPPRTEPVAVRRLDGAVREHALPVPQVIKIDTEGAEVLVLEGARGTLREHRPRLAVATHGAEPAAASIRLLESLGYACYGFVRGTGEAGGHDPWSGEARAAYRRLGPEDAEGLANNNIIASTREEDLREPLRPRSPADCLA